MFFEIIALIILFLIIILAKFIFPLILTLILYFSIIKIFKFYKFKRKSNSTDFFEKLNNNIDNFCIKLDKCTNKINQSSENIKNKFHHRKNNKNID